MKKFKKKYNAVNLTEAPAKMTSSIIKKWNNGEIQLLVGHAASIGHGIDGLQKNGSIIVWFGLPWNFEQYEQLNGRIDRQGQTKTVSIIKILCRNTTDMAVQDAIERKDTDQKGLKDSIDRYRNKITKVKYSFF
jgi:SNF2 family DNA or RNA helicase